MNEIDPARRFSMNAVRKFDGPAESEAASGLNDVARQVASQYRRDTMSPIMVSGVLRMVEFALLFVSGLCLYFYYVGFFNYLAWQYPVTIAAASFLAVVLL
ncbi:MAG: undecaprenyl-phosphate glucose phosphotransferase, partial [Mesorhizobium sp.]